MTSTPTGSAPAVPNTVANTVGSSTAASAASTDASSNATPNAQARIVALHEQLQQAVHELTSAAGWQQMLRTAAALPTYSPHNVLLITTQRPDATAVAGFHTWKQLGRSVRKGEKGIAILAPVLRRTRTASREATVSAPASTVQAGVDGTATAVDPASLGSAAGATAGAAHGSSRRLSGFRVVHVFDITQTDGPDLPAPPRAVRLDGQAPDGLLDGLSEQIRRAGFQLVVHDFDVPHPAMAGANGVTDHFAKTVVIRPDLSPAQTAKTLAHELGHVLLHAPGSRPAGLTREQAEVEAESVAFIVTAAHGLDSSTYTVPYVAGWAGHDPSLVATTAERVLRTAQTVLAHTPAASTITVPSEVRQQLRTREPITPTAREVTQQRSRASVSRRASASTTSLATSTSGAASASATAVARDRQTAGPGRGVQDGLW
jgi:DNA primase